MEKMEAVTVPPTVLKQEKVIIIDNLSDAMRDKLLSLAKSGSLYYLSKDVNRRRIGLNQKPYLHMDKVTGYYYIPKTNKYYTIDRYIVEDRDWIDLSEAIRVVEHNAARVTLRNISRSYTKFDQEEVLNREPKKDPTGLYDISDPYLIYMDADTEDLYLLGPATLATGLYFYSTEDKVLRGKGRYSKNGANTQVFGICNPATPDKLFKLDYKSEPIDPIIR